MKRRGQLGCPLGYDVAKLTVALSTRVHFHMKTEIFVCGLPSRSHVSGEYGDQKGKFS